VEEVKRKQEASEMYEILKEEYVELPEETAVPEQQ
jgi:hypothetical protein